MEHLDESTTSAAAARTFDELGQIRGILYNAAIQIYRASIDSLQSSHSESKVELALKGVDKILMIHNQLAEHSKQGILKQIPENLLQENAVKILNYIARKGGSVFRFELLTSRVIPGGRKIEYDRCVNVLLESGFIREDSSGQRKMTTYTVVYPECNQELLIEVNQ